MSFDTEYPQRKDRRKPYYKSKAVDRSCRPGGDCPYCSNGRLHKRILAEIDAELEIREYLSSKEK